MRTFFTLVKRELKSIKREKTILLAILIQFLIASFSSVILVGVMSFYDPASIGQNTRVTLDVGVVGDTDGSFTQLLSQTGRFPISIYADAETAEQAFQEGQIDTVVYVPEPTEGVVEMKLILPTVDTEKTLILMVLNEPLKEYEDYLRALNGVELNYKGIEGKPHTNYEFLYSVIVPILMLFPAFIAGSIVVDTVSEEMENKTLDTLWSAPVSLNQVFGSKVFAAILAAILQCALWAVLLRFNNFSIANLGLVLLLSAIIAGMISFGAAIVALYFKDRERAQFVYSMTLVAVGGVAYFIEPSPFSLLTRLATNDHYVGLPQVMLYLIPLVLAAAAFTLVSRKLVLARA